MNMVVRVQQTRAVRAKDQTCQIHTTNVNMRDLIVRLSSRQWELLQEGIWAVGLFLETSGLHDLLAVVIATFPESTNSASCNQRIDRGDQRIGGSTQQGTML